MIWRNTVPHQAEWHRQLLIHIDHSIIRFGQKPIRGIETCWAGAYNGNPKRTVMECRRRAVPPSSNSRGVQGLSCASCAQRGSQRWMHREYKRTAKSQRQSLLMLKREGAKWRKSRKARLIALSLSYRVAGPTTATQTVISPTRLSPRTFSLRTLSAYSLYPLPLSYPSDRALHLISTLLPSLSSAASMQPSFV